MDIVLIIIGSLLCILAVIGSLLPVLPGPLLAYIAFILLQLTSAHPFSWTFFIVRAMIIIFLTILDYFIPSRGTKKFGGTKRGVRGSNIGLVIAVIILPLFGIVLGPFGLLGLIGGPFLGAYLGEKYAGKQHEHALRSARGSFVGFITGSVLKLVVSIIMTGYFLANVYSILVN
ncbi:MAG: DUF456 domain-containing protein [candidate division SR1 bacterium]|nr:DUF456 domain-containing protein [candidate division SR1 bacterium]